MLADYEAGEVRFAGLGADATSTNAAAEQLAASLNDWVKAHPTCRIEQLSLSPAVSSTQSAPGAAPSYGAIAIMAYTEETIAPGDAAEAVAAAVVEIHEAQSGPMIGESDEEPPPEPQATR